MLLVLTAPNLTPARAWASLASAQLALPTPSISSRPGLAHGEKPPALHMCSVSARMCFFLFYEFRLSKALLFYIKTLILHAFNISQTVHQIKMV